jgi:DNA repair protein RadC
MTSPKAIKEFLVTELALCEKEVFAAVFLNGHHQVLSFEKLFYGTIDGTSVYPREVVKRALFHNSSAIIFAHNHPSGQTKPSDADKQITHKLKEALAYIDVKVLDHIIVGGSDTISFAEKGLI